MNQNHPYDTNCNSRTLQSELRDDTKPYSTTFGKITSQTENMNRFIQIQGRLRF